MSLEAAQKGVLSSAFHQGPEIWEYVQPEMLDDPYRKIAFAIQALHQRGSEVTVKTLTDECVARSVSPSITRWMVGPIEARAAAVMFMDAVGQEKIAKSLLIAQNHLEAGMDGWRVVDDLVDNLATIPRPQRDQDGAAWNTYDEVLGFHSPTPSWVLPRLLAHRERLVITGGEGQGKSTLIYQLALGAAFGVSPINHQDRFDPQRVLILDVENAHETQVSRHYQIIGGQIRSLLGDQEFQPSIGLLKQRTIDLAQPDQRRTLLDAVDQFQPDLLVMGSAYKLVEDQSEWFMAANAIMRTADEAKAKSGCAVIIEAHAGHGFNGDRNGYRPDGSSVWLRWPEFGVGLHHVPSQGRLLVAKRWRGDRVMDRDWPAGWRSSAVLPWSPVREDELEALL